MEYILNSYDHKGQITVLDSILKNQYDLIIKNITYGNQILQLF